MTALAGTLTSGGTTSAEATGQTEKLLRVAHVVLDNCGLAMSASKVSRLVRNYEAQVAGNGWTFFDFLANRICLDAERRRLLLLNPEVARVISYADPTGETAVNRVLRGRSSPPPHAERRRQASNLDTGGVLSTSTIARVQGDDDKRSSTRPWFTLARHGVASLPYFPHGHRSGCPMGCPLDHHECGFGDPIRPATCYGCSSVGHEALVDRGNSEDPRCRCARQLGVVVV